MKIQEACLPCLVSLGVRCAALIPAASRPAFYRDFFHTLANVDFDQPAPLAIGLLYRLIKQKAKTGQHTGGGRNPGADQANPLGSRSVCGSTAAGCAGQQFRF